jgi:hypothetical protein
VGLRTRRSIRIHDSYSFLTGPVLKETFLGPIIACAGKTSEVKEDGNFVQRLSGGRGEVEVQGHLATSCRRFMG